MAKPVLGILTLYLNDNKMLEERPVYQRMTVAGRKLGLEVFVFTPQDVQYKTNRIHALFYDPVAKKWSRQWTSFPTMIFDRCRIQKSHRFQQLLHFRSRYSHLLFLNKPLRNKWTVYTTLAKSTRFKPYLPHTRLYTSSSDLNDMLRRYPLLYLKPINGTGGRGILRIERSKDGTVLIQGRDHSRRIISPQRVRIPVLHSRLASWELKQKKYLVQQGIQLKLSDGRVHDYRMLVQKNGEGQWEVTGCAGRIGASRSITSNLHGGGKAATMLALLRPWVGSESRAESVKQEAYDFGVDVAAYLESQFNRLCELALDIAIDRHGNIWLLEVNPKPAREVFAQSGERHTYNTAIIRPLEYAMWVFRNRQQRRSSLSRDATPEEQ